MKLSRLDSVVWSVVGLLGLTLAVVLAVGDCAVDCGMFRRAYGVAGAAGDVVDVDVSVPGCPPRPEQIVAALREVTGR